MSLQTFPKPAQVGISAIVLLAAVGVCVCAMLFPVRAQDLLVILPGLLVCAGAALITVPVVGAYQSGNGLQNSSMSLGMIPTFLLLLAYGPFVGAMAGMVTALVATLHPIRSHGIQVWFSMAAVALAVLAASPVLLLLGLANGAGGFSPRIPTSGFAQIEQALATLAAGALYFFTNTALIVVVISLVNRTATADKMMATWRDNYLWLFPAYIAGATAAALLYVLLPYALIYWQSSIALLTLAVPVPVLAYYAAKSRRESDVNYHNYIKELERGREELRGLYTATMESFALAIDAKDRHTQEHIQRVKTYAMDLAREMRVSESDLKAVEYGALLHDIGKIAIPENILCKPGKLTPDEFETMKTHTIIGARILEPVQFPFPVRDVVRSHHERWDGTGYPDALRGEQIPIGARILAVTDVYDALMSDRSYRRAWSRADTMAYLQKQMGTHFDPHVVSAFLRILRREDEQAITTDDDSAAIAGKPFAPR